MKGRGFVLAAVLSAGFAQGAAALDCAADMTDAHRRIAALKARDGGIDTFLKARNVKGACGLLLENLKDMTAARDSMKRCLTGFDRNENVGQMNANLADMGGALAAHCN